MCVDRSSFVTIKKKKRKKKERKKKRGKHDECEGMKD